MNQEEQCLTRKPNPCRIATKFLFCIAFIALSCTLAHADSAGIPATQVSMNVDIGSLACVSVRGGCPNQNASTAGGISVSGYGGDATATAALGTDPSVTATATSDAVTSAGGPASVFASSEVIYSVEIVPIGQAGAPSAPLGIPFTLSFVYDYISTFGFISTPIGEDSYISGGVFADGPALFLPLEVSASQNCPQSTQCSASGEDFMEPNAPQGFQVGATCDLSTSGMCSMTTDPTITIDPAYAPYYTVVFNPDLTSGSGGSSGSTGPSTGVPEPGSLVLLGFGLPLLAAVRCRFRR